MKTFFCFLHYLSTMPSKKLINVCQSQSFILQPIRGSEPIAMQPNQSTHESPIPTTNIPPLPSPAKKRSLDAEAGIYAMAFDHTGSRLVTCEADKTLKIWAEDTTADEDSHPIDMKGWTKQSRLYKRY